MEELEHSSSWELLINGRCAPMDHIIAHFSPTYNRKPYPKVDESMETLWKAKLDNNNHLYNQSKFRLHNVTEDFNNIHLHVGMTDYRETVCTNHLPCAEEIEGYGQSHYNDPHSCFGDAIGVGGVVVTSDGFIVLIKRSNWVAESQGCYDTPGGHAEPDEMRNKLNLLDTDIFRAKSSDVMYEIFHSFVREVRDEINAPESSLSWPLLLGIARNKQYGGKPGMVFCLKCNISRKEIEYLYFLGGAETDESTELMFISSESLVKDGSLAIPANMAPIGRLSLLLYIQQHQNLV